MTLTPKAQKLVTDYADRFTNLTPDTLDHLMELVAPEVRFSDPFHKVRGKAAFQTIFTHMFETTSDPKFIISDIAYSTTNDTEVAYLRWRMTAHTKGWPSIALVFEGMSEVHIGNNALITAHIDHWDSASQLLSGLPLIGALIRPIMRLFQIKSLRG